MKLFLFLVVSIFSTSCYTMPGAKRQVYARGEAPLPGYSGFGGNGNSGIIIGPVEPDDPGVITNAPEQPDNGGSPGNGDESSSGSSSSEGSSQLSRSDHSANDGLSGGSQETGMGATYARRSSSEGSSGSGSSDSSSLSIDGSSGTSDEAPETEGGPEPNENGSNSSADSSDSSDTDSSSSESSPNDNDYPKQDHNKTPGGPWLIYPPGILRQIF